MGDLTTSPAAEVENAQKPAQNGVAGPPPTTNQSDLPPTGPDQPSQEAFVTQLDVSNDHQALRQGAYNMSPMANALPQVSYRGGQYPHGAQQRFNPAASPPMMPQVAHMPQYGPSPSMPVPGQGYYAQHPHANQYYGGGQMSPTQSSNTMPPRPNMGYYSNQMMMGHNQSNFYYPSGTQYGAHGQGMPSAVLQGQFMPGSPTSANDPRAMNMAADAGRLPLQQSRGILNGNDSTASTVRGPPRKPRQSGHAIWIGNLPPQTDLMSLVHHVCKEATGLESLFLISKSNCAFANFKDEAACVGAQQKLHDSKFQSVRLVSRLRKSAVEGAGGTIAPTGPASNVAANPSATPQDDNAANATTSETDSSTSATAATGETPQPRVAAVADGAQQDRFFILKSLTVEDLELSVRTGIWATQSHNEEALNHAFKVSENVYLVFSANKSGEYFGYARMTSEIDNDPESAIQFAPKVQAATDIDLPKAIPTDPTEFAPKGRIIDDSARGTIFWEVDREDSEAGSGDEEEESEAASSKDAEGEEEGAKTWGKPFKLEWLSNTRLPFYRTRGLRNPWNSNREVKIARDGTELEPVVGRKLIGLFNRWQNPPQYASPMRAAPMGMMPGFPQPPPPPQMRPFGP